MIWVFGFAEVRILPSILVTIPYDVIFLSLGFQFSNTLSSIIYAICPERFSSPRCLDLILQMGEGWKHPRCCTDNKKSSAFRVNHSTQNIYFWNAWEKTLPEIYIGMLT